MSIYRTAADVPPEKEREEPKYFVAHMLPMDFGNEAYSLKRMKYLAGLPEDSKVRQVIRTFDDFEQATEYMSSVSSTAGITKFNVFYGYMKVMETEVEVVTEKRVSFKTR